MNRTQKGYQIFLTKHYPGASYECAYEASFGGFWIHEQLTELGIKCIVVNAADVPTTEKERQQKTDVRDSRKIARSLSNRELEAIYIPPKWQQLDRGFSPASLSA